MQTKTIFTRTLLAASLFAMFQAAYAESETQEQELQNVVVTGSMNRVGVVPFRQAKSAVAISRENLEAQNVQKTDEIARYQAGFSNQVFGSDTNTNWFRVRGTEATQAVNGMPVFEYGFFKPLTEIYGVEAVEVTKGADSITFGAANSGGLINYISKRANRNQVGKGEVRLSGGNKGHYGLAGDYTGSLNADNSLRYRVTGSYKHADGEWDKTDNGTLYIAPTVQWDITPHTRLDILASYQRDKGTPSSNFLPQEGTLRPFPDGSYISRNSNYGDPVNDTETNKQYGLGYEFSHKLDNNLTFNSSYRYSKADNYHRGAYVYPFATNYVVSRGVVFNNGTSKSHNFDNRLTWKFKNNWLDNTLVGGVDYRNQKVDALYTFFGSTTSTNLLNPQAGWGQAQNVSAAPRQNIKATQLGFYLQNQARINKQFTVGLGVRHDRAENEENISNQKIKDNHTSYSASVMYHAPKGFNPYISYNESFRLLNGVDGLNNLHDPNITKQTEIGVKYAPAWLDGNLSLAAFRAKDKGALYSRLVNGAMITKNDSDTTRKGIEFQADVNVLENLNVSAAYTYLSVVQNNADSDVRQPLFPKHTLSLKTAYTFNQGSLNGLTLGAGMRYIGNSVTANGSLYSGAKVPSATLFDVMARYPFGNNWTAQLNVDNVGDRRYLGGCDYYCYYGAGRNINASISYKF
ncbi:TonB-dependent siderophore receptor [Wielerella bovis]|uniref:TonB-dependent siderophore receptor n=1 Tax=Wielerella bovis TaxID=2917790 RepID=UPI0020197A13|nr:TonB-dependent siderophore receptor [Wielerella bovis]ULJ60939.1 TonB-dependent siderophore receptor [Wielerella bovis]